MPRSLQRILNVALDDVEGFGSAHHAQVLEAAGKADIDERLRAVRMLLAEEMRVAMMIGAAVGFELAHELMDKEEQLMAVDVRWLGHSAFHLSGGGADVLVDPFLTGNPKAAVERRRRPRRRDRCSPTATATTTATRSPSPSAPARPSWRSPSSRPRSPARASRTSTTPTSAARSCSTGAGSSSSPPGTPRTDADGTFHTPAGLLIHYGGHLIYHLGDTALFSDLQLIAPPRRPGRRSRSCRSAATTRWIATTPSPRCELINPSQVIPIHYNTFPPIETDAEAFKDDVQNAGFSQVFVLEPGDTHHAEMTHAVVLIEAEREAIATLGGALADVAGVAEAYSVTGEWDFVAMLRVRKPEDVHRS